MVGLNTASKPDGGRVDDREYNTEVVFLPALTPGTPGLSELIGVHS